MGIWPGSASQLRFPRKPLKPQKKWDVISSFSAIVTGKQTSPILGSEPFDK